MLGKIGKKERREAEPKGACFSPFVVRFFEVVRKLCINLENGSRFPEKEKSQEPHDSWENPCVFFPKMMRPAKREGKTLGFMRLSSALAF